MIRIIVADDEYYARKALVKVLKQIPLEIEVAADLETGAEVAAYLEQGGRADIVVTDIRMPDMDGIALSAHLMQHHPDISVIIASGYSDFSYAQQAMGYGVKNYLVKPIQLESLCETIEKIVKEKQEQKQYIADQVQRQSMSRTAEYLSIGELQKNTELYREFIYPVFAGNAKKSYQLIIIQWDGPCSADSRKQLEQRIRSGWCQETMACFYFKRYQEFVVLLFTDDEQRDARRSKTKLFALLKEARDNLGQSLAIASGRFFRSSEDLGKAYYESVYAINQRLLDGWNRIYEYQGNIMPENLLVRQKEVLLQEALIQYQEQRAAGIVKEVLAAPMENAYSLYVTIMGILSVFNHVHSERSQQDKEENSYMLFSFKTDLYRFHHLEKVQEYLLHMVADMCTRQEESPETGSRFAVRELVEYLEKNYQYDISLQELAAHKFFMNYSYISRQFKQEVGQTFSKYLIELRMRKAREFLEGELLKINDIARLVGYNDVSHFIQSFRKKQGCTPEEYRNQYRKNKERE